MRSIVPPLAFALLSVPTGPVTAQVSPGWDPVMAGQGAALTAMNRRNAQRLTGRSADRRGTHRSGAVPACADLASLRDRLGSLSRDEYMRYRACQGLKP